MPETSAALERKAPGRVMGGAASIALNQPFPIDQKGKTDLNLLSHIASRILATPDIYDLANLSTHGVCGAYSLFLKDKIMQQLLPFASEFTKKDINQKGESQIYLYQNPRKVFDDQVTQKQVCAELALSIMRLVSTVMACLASIQYKEAIDRPTIETIMAPPVGVKQVGGSRADVTNWFVTYGYMPTPVAGAPATVDVKLASANPTYPDFVLKPLGTSGPVSNWLLQVDPASLPTFPAISKGGFRVQTIDPISLPGLPAGTDTILPIRIYDVTTSWVVGILQGGVTKIFKPIDGSTGNAFDAFEVLFNLFMRAAGQPGELPEKRPDKIAEATRVFQRGPPALLTTMTPYLRTIPGFNPALIPGSGIGPGAGPGPGGYGGYGVPPPGYGYGGYGVPPPPPGYGGYGIPPPPPPGYGGYGAPPSYGYGSTPGPRALGIPAAIGATGVVDIPDPSVKSFLAQLHLVPRKLTFIDNSCPAAIRASTLAALIHTDKTISTNVCIDEYWKKSKMDTIWPYATLQLLCADDLTKLNDAPPRNINQTWIDFVEALRQIYPAVPAGTTTQKIPAITPANEYHLAKFGFHMGALDLCKSGPAVTVQYPAVQDALIKINTCYTAHVAKMWDILNSLVIVIKDPDTKKDLVRLNPALLTGSTKANIDVIAQTAMKLIAIHYVEIEKIYTDAVKILEPTKPFVK
jgi:hypothetical protein